MNKLASRKLLLSSLLEIDVLASSVSLRGKSMEAFHPQYLYLDSCNVQKIKLLDFSDSLSFSIDSLLITTINVNASEISATIPPDATKSLGPVTRSPYTNKPTTAQLHLPSHKPRRGISQPPYSSISIYATQSSDRVRCVCFASERCGLRIRRCLMSARSRELMRFEGEDWMVFGFCGMMK
jgi:hypothetical protein